MTDAPKDTVFPDTLMIRDTGIREDSGRRIHTTAGFGYKKIAYTRTDLAEANERAAYLRGLEDAAAFCESHAAAIPYGEHRHTAPTYAGYVMDEIDHEAEFNHQGNGYAAAIRALAKEGGE